MICHHDLCVIMSCEGLFKINLSFALFSHALYSVVKFCIFMIGQNFIKIQAGLQNKASNGIIIIITTRHASRRIGQQQSSSSPVCHWPASRWCPSCGSCSSYLLLQFFTRLSSVDQANGITSLQLWPRSGETQSLNILPFKPGGGQYIAIHAALTARDFLLAYFYLSSQFTLFFPKPLPIFPMLAVANTQFLCRPTE